jgi:hypothetical protein
VPPPLCCRRCRDCYLSPFPYCSLLHFVHSIPTSHTPRCSCRDWAGISYTKFVSLNPLLLCGILNPVPGVLVCAGDKLSFCSNFYRTVAGDTCASLAPLGTVVGLAAGVSCATPLPVDTEVCLAPTANQVRALKLHAPCCERPALLLLGPLAHGAASSLCWHPRRAVNVSLVVCSVTWPPCAACRCPPT